MNRGVDKRTIVLSNADRLRFVNDLFIFNDTERVENLGYVLKNNQAAPIKKSERLVTIHAWCLMGNHYHMLLSDTVENGMSLFLKKLNAGYAKYFNKKYNRSGALFQGKTKRVHIQHERHFLYILPYIHLNPLDLKAGSRDWRIEHLQNPHAAIKWITDYRWSSFRNYAGEKEFAHILENSELFEDRKEHVEELRSYLRAAPDPSLASINLE